MNMVNYSYIYSFLYILLIKYLYTKMISETDTLNALTVESENDELTALDLSGRNNLKLVSTKANLIYDAPTEFALEYENLNFNLSDDIEIVSATVIRFKPKSVYRLFHAHVDVTGGGVSNTGIMNSSLYMNNNNRVDISQTTYGDRVSFGYASGMFSIPAGESRTLSFSTIGSNSTSSCNLLEFEAYIKFL